jgi:hypothetical protein
MKRLNLSTQYGKPFTYIVDEELLIGIYKTIKTEYLNDNDKKLLTKHNVSYNKLFRINNGVLLKAKLINGSRIAFLITEDICFDGLTLISEKGFEGRFYNEFVEAFEMLDTQQYEDEAWFD